MKRVYKRKSTEFLQRFYAPAGIELLNLWNDFLKVVRFIDDNAIWLHPLLDKVAVNKKSRGEIDYLMVRVLYIL